VSLLLHLDDKPFVFFSDPKPVVECSFVTEFEDHIYVAMDAEVFLFLHDLVMAYISEKDKGNFAVNLCNF
jgi:hypothetical protein